MKSLVLALVTFCCLTISQNAQSKASRKNITLTTFNLKWFGIGGSLWNTPDMEYRESYIKKFIEQELSRTDIFVFTEVTHPDLLQKIFSKRLKCVSYERPSERHQKIVTCYNFKKLRVEKYDSDYEITEVALGSTMQRPASQVKICEIDGNCFLQVIGVHLAAGRKSEKRLEQISLLSEALKKQNNPLPTVITGDFNSYISAQSGLPQDDIELFEGSLSSSKRHYTSINRGLKTYNTGERARTYDHIIVSNEIHFNSVIGYEACETAPDLSKDFIPYYSFSRYYSDHCPVTAQLIIPKNK